MVISRATNFHILDGIKEELGRGPGTSGVSSYVGSALLSSNMAKELNFVEESVQKVFGNIEIQGVPTKYPHVRKSQSPGSSVKN